MKARSTPVMSMFPLAALVLFGVGLEVREAPRSAKAPPGATRITFGDLGGSASSADRGPAKAGDYLKALPGSTLKLDGQRVFIQGFMIPTQNEDNRVREFFLARNQATCCFGFPLQVADVVEVRMIAKPADSLMDRIVGVSGRLHVHEHWAGPYLGSLFQMEADSVTPETPPAPLTLAGSPQPGRLE